MTTLNRDQLIRYSRQIMLPQVGTVGQETLAQSKALLIGLGGLGSPAALYLAAAGVGELTLADFDHVELSNLQRQVLHGVDDIGRDKVDSAAESLLALNPTLKINRQRERLNPATLTEFIAEHDIVLDGCDNFPTRFAVNAACQAAKTPLVSGAAVRLEGQLMSFRFDQQPSPCYRCVFPESDEAAETCAGAGILAPVVGILGSLQALEAIKILLDFDTATGNQLHIFDALNSQFRQLTINADRDCPVCG